MNTYLIDPADCLILRALRDSSSLREAAAQLACDPSGLARRIKQISKETGFVQKVENRWQLNARGLDVVVWAEETIESQRRLLSEKQSTRIASTMWFAEEVLVPNANLLQKSLGPESALSFSVPDRSFESALVNGSVDFVIVCHPPENPEIEHRQIMNEEWVIAAPKSWGLNAKSTDLLSALAKRPFIRHTNLNVDLFLPEITTLRNSGFEFDNLIGIRTAIRSGLGWSLVPKLLVERDRSANAKMISIVGPALDVTDRKVCLWWLRGRAALKRQSPKVAAWLKESLT